MHTHTPLCYIYKSLWFSLIRNTTLFVTVYKLTNRVNRFGLVQFDREHHTICYSLQTYKWGRSLWFNSVSSGTPHVLQSTSLQLQKYFTVHTLNVAFAREWNAPLTIPSGHGWGKACLFVCRKEQVAVYTCHTQQKSASLGNKRQILSLYF